LVPESRSDFISARVDEDPGCGHDEGGIMGGRRVVGRVVVLARAVLAVGPPGPVSAPRVVRWPLRTRRLVLLLLAVGMLSVLAYGLASAATSVDLSVPSWNERYFSPNGDDQEDTATVLYCLGQSATSPPR
jgi:hypothetical protein